jgi:hypothetical protein
MRKERQPWGSTGRKSFLPKQLFGGGIFDEALGFANLSEQWEDLRKTENNPAAFLPNPATELGISRQS